MRALAVTIASAGLFFFASPETKAFAADDPPPLPPPAASSSSSSAPAAASATIDSVHLRNGGLYRGRVTEIVPGDHVTIQVEKGETKKIAWAEIDRVIVASSAAIPPPPTTSATPGAAAPATPPIDAPMTGPRAMVHITTSKSLILYRKPAGSNAWVQACNSPCNRELPINDTYRITGNAVASSKEFHIEASPGGSVDIAVDPPSMPGMLFGGFVGAGGATTAYVGLLLALIGASDSSKNCYSGSYGCDSRKSDAEKLRNGGLIAMGIGTGMTVAGILIFLASAKTDVVQSAGKGSSMGSAAPPKQLDAFLRQPSWKGASSTSSETANAGILPASSFPLVLQGSF